MPSNVKNYLGLSIVGIAIGLVAAYFNFDDALAKIPMANASTVLIISYAVGFAISIGLIAAVAWGRQNWARWLQAVLFVLGLPFLIKALPTMFATNTFQAGTTIIQTIIQAVALFFIFTGDAKAWFRKAG